MNVDRMLIALIYPKFSYCSVCVKNDRLFLLVRCVRTAEVAHCYLALFPI